MKIEKNESEARTKLYSGLPLLCAKGWRGGPCHGDSGSPAVIDGKLAGIVSHGPPNCDSLFYKEHHVYTNIEPYFDWILENTGKDAQEIKDFSYSKKISNDA